MSSKDRRAYLTATVLDQALLDFCQDNLECRLEMICEIQTPGGGWIYASDRNKYVGGVFYEALLVFPVIGRTVGEWLAPTLQFSTLNLELSNVDGRFNHFMPGGADFGNWIGKDVVVKLGIAEQSSTYTTVFKGKVTDIGGFKRSVKSATIIARDNYDLANRSFPIAALLESDYPKIEPKMIGKLFPVVYGDFTVGTEPAPASVPALIVNGNDPRVTFKEKNVLAFSGPATPAVVTCTDHDFDLDDPIQFSTSGSLPAPFAPAVTYYAKPTTQDAFQVAATPGGAAINSSGAGSGEHKVIIDPAASKRPVKAVVAGHDLTFFGDTYLKRGDEYFLVSAGLTIGTGNRSFTLAQGGTWVSGGPYLFDSADEFFVKVKGKDLGAYDDNLVAQARDILTTYGDVSSGDFHANWDTYRDKSSPAESAISTFKSRVWIGEQQQALTYALSMLEQVRLEAFIDRSLKVKINSLHFEDWNPAPSHVVRNWDVVRDSFGTAIDDQNNFNAAQGNFNYLPDVNVNAYATAIYKNTAAVTQVGKRIAKLLVFPNLYVEATAALQVQEILKLASASIETIVTALTWRALLVDIGDFVSLRVSIGSTIFDSVPAMVRDVGYDPSGLKVVVKLWSMAMAPFPGYVPGYSGTVGGYSATIVEET